MLLMLAFIAHRAQQLLQIGRLNVFFPGVPFHLGRRRFAAHGGNLTLQRSHAGLAGISVDDGGDGLVAQGEVAAG